METVYRQEEGIELHGFGIRSSVFDGRAGRRARDQAPVRQNM